MKLLLAPSLVVIGVFAAALMALLRYSLVEFIPGSLQTGGLTADNFRAEIGRAHV